VFKHRQHGIRASQHAWTSQSALAI